MAKFYHIYLDPRADVTMDHIKEKMNLAVDWFKYDSKNWIVYTTSDAKKWYARLEPFIKPGGNVFMCAFDVNDYYGWMSKELWTWIENTSKK